MFITKHRLDISTYNLQDTPLFEMPQAHLSRPDCAHLWTRYEWPSWRAARRKSMTKLWAQKKKKVKWYFSCFCDLNRTDMNGGDYVKLTYEILSYWSLAPELNQIKIIWRQTLWYQQTLNCRQFNVMIYSPDYKLLEERRSSVIALTLYECLIRNFQCVDIQIPADVHEWPWICNDFVKPT